MKTNQHGLDLIKHFESLHDGDLSRIGAQPKMDPIGIWTVGYGKALWNPAKKDWYKGEKDRAIVCKMYPAMTEAEAADLLLHDLPPYEQAVLQWVKRRDFNDDQFSALVSFMYNCGATYRNKGKEIPYALWQNIDNRLSPEKLRAYWDSSVIKAGGNVLPGLVRRRKAEAHLYLTGTLKLQW